MKTYSKPKQCNVESVEHNRPAVHRAFDNGKLRRDDFRRLLVRTGRITYSQLAEERKNKTCNRIVKAIDKVAEDCTRKIQSRRLDLRPVREFQRVDGISGKLRNLCQETPEQQIFEYIAVYSMERLFKAKLLPCQYGSVPGRGQVNGKRRIERIIRRKLLRNADAVKCDVQKAYPSTTTECVMKLLRRDIRKNKALLWLASAIMENYPGGVLLIGGYWSTWAFNYVMAYVLRYLMGQAKVRRGIRQRAVQEVVCYADDFVLFGRLSQLQKAVKKATKWAEETLGLHIKNAWLIIHTPSFQEEHAMAERRRAGSARRTPGVDMMGYVVRRTYTIIRGKIFIRIRRQLLRAAADLKSTGRVPWWRAAKIVSYYGWIKNSDSRKMCKKYDVQRIVAASKVAMARHARKGTNYGNLCREAGTC